MPNDPPDARRASPAPEAYVPFRISSAAADAAARAWLTRKANGAELVRLRAVFVPFFLYVTRARATYRGVRIELRTTRKILRGLRGPSGYPLEQVGTERTSSATQTGEVALPRETLHVPAVRDLPNRAVEGLPFVGDEALLPFDAGVVGESDVRRVTRSESDAREIAELALRARLEDAARRKIGGVDARVDDLEPCCEIESTRLVLLPFYAGALRVAGVEHALALDGFQGHIAADLPAGARRDPWRWLSRAALALMLAVVLVGVMLVNGIELDEIVDIIVLLGCLVATFGAFLVLQARLHWFVLAPVMIALAIGEVLALQWLDAGEGLVFGVGALLAVLLGILLLASFPSRARERRREEHERMRQR